MLGVFICQCGTNISATVDTGAVAAAAAGMRGVAHAESIQYTCSDPGQAAIGAAVREKRLDRIVIAACSPRMHEATFRRALERAGLNPYMMEMVNIREQCSWIHADTGEATMKAVDLVRKAVARIRAHVPLQGGKTAAVRRALVIGGGIAGIRAALDISAAGIPVTLVEKSPSIGGNMARLDKTFPTLDCSSCILTPLMVEIKQHDHIELMTNAEVDDVRGLVGDFQIDIRRRSTCVDEEKCTGCMICQEKCPAPAPDDFNAGLCQSKAISVAFPQAVPLVASLRKQYCRRFNGGKCRLCQKLCPAGAVDYGQEDEVVSRSFGAVVAATGYGHYDWTGSYPTFGKGLYPDVITSAQYERLLSASGPTGGLIRRPSDGAEPRQVAFVSCVGSRDESAGRPQCCSVGCMYTAKQAILTKEHIPDSQSYIFYIDMRAGGKNYEEFVRRAQTRYGAIFIRGRVGRIFPRRGKLVVMGTDTLAGDQVEIEADLVVLAAGLTAAPGAGELARKLNIACDETGFMAEEHPKLRPVEAAAAGVFLAGACQGPKDIPATVAQAGAAAAKVIGLLSRGELETSPMVSAVNPSRCAGCFKCRDVCPFGAIDKDRLADGLVTARVIESLCRGCGICNAACPPGAISLNGYTDKQLLAELVEVLR